MIEMASDLHPPLVNGPNGRFVPSQDWTPGPAAPSTLTKSVGTETSGASFALSSRASDHTCQFGMFCSLIFIDLASSTGAVGSHGVNRPVVELRQQEGADQ